MADIPDMLLPLQDAPSPESTAPGNTSVLTDAIRQTQDRQRQDFTATLQTVRPVNPDQFAKAVQVERYSGVSADVLYKHREDMDRLLEGNKYGALYDSYAKTARALSDGRMAALAQDDIDNLSRVERAAQQTRFEEQGWAERNLFTPAARWWESRSQRSSFGQVMLNDQQIANFDAVDAAEAAGEVPFPTRQEREGLGAYGLQYLRGTPEERALMRQQLIGGKDVSIENVAQREQNIQQLPVDSGALRTEELGGGLAATAEAISEDPAYIWRVTAESAPNTVEMLGGALVAGLPGAAAVGFNAEKGYKRIDVLREAGVDLTNPTSILEALQNDDLMLEAEKRANLKALGTTAVDVLSMGLAGRLLVPTAIGGRALTGTQRELANLAVQFPVQGITEGAGEAAGQALADGEVDWGEVLLEAISGSAMSSLDVAVFSGDRLMSNVQQGLADSRRARAGANALGEMVDSALNSKLRGRDVDSYQQLTSQQLKDSALEMISIPAKALLGLNQSAAAPLQQILDAIPGMTEQLAEAEARGGDVMMPTADYLAHFAQYHEQLAGAVRVGSESMSLDDVSTWQAEQASEMEALVESMVREPNERDAAYIQMMGELQQSGFRRQDAEQYVATHLSAMSTLAQRTGKPLGELLERFPLSVRNTPPDSVRQIPVDDMRLAIQRLRAGDVPQSRDMFGVSLAQYLRDSGGLLDDGGELAALDADVGKVGRNRLARSDGRSLDEAAMAAWERGYFPGVAREDVGPQLIIDAIRDDLNDIPRFSVEQENATLRDQAVALEELQGYLDQMDVDLTTLTDDEVLAMLRSAAPEQAADRSLNQSSRFSEDNRLSNLSMSGPSWERLRQNNPALRRVKTADDVVTIYRATIGDSIRPDDFVGVDRAVAEMELENVIDRDGDSARIIEQRVPVRDLLMGNDSTEFVYYPASRSLNQSPVSAQDISERLRNKHPGLKLDLAGRGDVVTLSRIVVPEDARESGVGSAVMADLLEWADQSRKTLALTPSADFGGSKARLGGFYKRFGFVENKGRTKDYEISESMYRLPALNQGDDSGVRGSINFSTSGQRDFQITLGGRRDLSTLLHEFGHYYLEVITDLAADADASPQLAADVVAIRKWTGAKETGPFEIEQHETFARGFERYLAEGKAPNAELQGAFSRFKRWMIAIYKDLTRLNVELTDEIRSVMDRIVATDEQIRDAERVTQAMPLFESAAAAGMTDAEFRRYQESVELAHAEAATSVEQQIIREEERRRGKWWREEMAKVRQEVAEELDTVREYAAIKALRSGDMPDGTRMDIKLDSSEIRERYGFTVLRRLPFMHAKKGGTQMDIAAEVLGYNSGDEMIKAILATPSRAEALRIETDQRMLDRHGPRASGESAEAAMAAVHNEKRAAVLIKELSALGKRGNRNNMTSQQVMRQAAERIMQQRKLREIQPFEYQRAEATAGRLAFEAASRGDLDTAFQQKQAQLLNFYLWREARKAREQVEKMSERLYSYNRTTKREKLGKAGHDYLDQIDAVMEQYEFRTVSLRELDKRVSFAEWYQKQLELGNEPMVPEFILNTSRRVNYKDLSLEQMTELYEFVENVNHLAGLKNKLLANQRLRDFEEAKNILVATARANLDKRKPLPIDKTTMGLLARTNNWADEMSASLLKMEQVVEWLDGGEIDGPWRQTIWQPFVEAQVAKDDLNRDFTIEMTRMVDEYTRQRGQKAMHEQIFIPEIGQSLTRNAIISAALNTGNASNRDKLLKGYGWDEGQLAAILSNMNRSDWEFAQSLWDLVERLWPQIEQLEKDMHGIPPAKVEATPVLTQHGEFSGGYWPLVYDTSAAAYAGVANQLTDNTGLFEQGYAKATTPKGHTKARVDSFAAPIILDTGIVTSHLGQVIHDLTHRRAIRDAAKIISNREVKQTLNDVLGEPLANQFNPWLQGIANDMVMDSQKGIDAWTKLMGQLRANLSVAWMGFSASTGIQQIMGMSQSFEFMSQKGGRRYMLQGMREFVTHPLRTIQFVRELSGEMRNRDTNLDNNMRDVMRRISGKVGVLPAVQRLAFKHISIIQAMVDYPTWMAGYHQAMAQGVDADLAIQAGDRAVRLSQMAAGPKDLAAVQRKDGLMKALTIVYSYFNLLYNRQTDIKRSLQSAQSVSDYLQAFERTIFLIALPAVVAPLLVGQGPGEDDEWSEWAMLKIVTYPLMGIPLARDVAGAIESGWGYRGATPIGALGETIVRLSDNVKAEEPDAERITMTLLDAAGYGFGIPSAQPKRTLRYLFDVAAGERDDDNALEFMRGIMFGPPKD